MPWDEYAACRGMGEGIFFSRSERIQGRALEVCDGCPVWAECAEFALEMEAGDPPSYRHGIYGGFTPEERGKLA